jgi:hypothetical protein
MLTMTMMMLKQLNSKNKEQSRNRVELQVVNLGDDLILLCTCCFRDELTNERLKRRLSERMDMVDCIIHANTQTHTHKQTQTHLHQMQVSNSTSIGTSCSLVTCFFFCIAHDGV